MYIYIYHRPQNTDTNHLMLGNVKDTRVSMEASNYLVSWFITYLQDLQPTYIGVIIRLLSTMDVPVGDRWVSRWQIA